MNRLSCCMILVVFMNLTTVLCRVNAETADSTCNHGMGILNIRSQSIEQSFRLSFPLVVPGDIKQGWDYYSSLTWTNVWAEERCYLMDYEMMDFYGGFSRGFRSGWGIALAYDNRSYFGGALDGLVQGFHDMLGISQNHRDERPKNRAIIQRFDRDTGVLMEEISPGDLNNSGINFLVNYNLFHGSETWPSINFYGVTRFVLESPKIFTRDNRLQTGAGLGLAKQWTDRFYTYGVLGYTFYGNDSMDRSDRKFRFKNEQMTAMAALAWQLNSGCSLLAQYLYSSSVLEDVWGLEDDSHEIHLGVKFNLGKDRTLDLALVENIFTMDNSPDFGLHFALSRHF